MLPLFRLKFIRFVLLPFLLCMVAGVGSGFAGPPNIIIMVADDHGYGDLSALGAVDDVSTPHLDQLAAEGIRFTQGYATSPICTPSRIGLLLGKYQQRFGNFWYGSPGLPDPSVPTIAETLKGAGYATGLIGKIHFNSNFGVEQRNHPLNHGFDFWYGFNGPAKHYLIHNAEAEAVFMEKLMEHQPEKKGYPLMFLGPIFIDKTEYNQEGFSTTLFKNQAIDFIDRHQEDPFFLMISWNAVHDQNYQLPADYLEQHGIPQARDWDPSVESSQEWGAATYSDTLNRQYNLGQLYYLDQAVGKIRDHLRSRGLLENTVIIYTSDNGGSLATGARNDPLNNGKFTMFEGGNRVPFIISWPGTFPQGEIWDNVVSALDFHPTAAAMAGLDPELTFDGKNLLPLLLGDEPDLEHETLVWDVGDQFAIRHRDWKLRFCATDARAWRRDPRPGIQLTRLDTDPGEQKNWIEDYPEIAGELMQRYREWQVEITQFRPR